MITFTYYLDQQNIFFFYIYFLIVSRHGESADVYKENTELNIEESDDKQKVIQENRYSEQIKLTKVNPDLTDNVHALQVVKQMQLPVLDLPDVEILDQTYFVIQPSAQSQSLSWDNFGFSLHVPPYAVSSENVVTVAVSISGMFEFPVGTIPVSAIFYLHSSQPLSKQVILEMEHCCNMSHGSNTRLKFAKASTDKKSPYKFLCLPSGDGDDCVSTSYYGQLSVSSFSMFSELIDSLTGRSSQPIEYFAQIQYKQNGPRIWNIIIIVAKKLKPFQHVSINFVSCLLDVSL